MAESNKWMPAAVFGGLATIAGAIFFNKPAAPTAPAAPDAITITAAQPTVAPSAALTASTPASQVATPAPQVAEVKPAPAPQAEPAPARPKVAHKRVSKPAPAAAPVPTDESTYSAGPIRVEQAPPPPPLCSSLPNYPQPENTNQVAGTIIGGIAGALGGNQMGKGRGKTAMTVITAGGAAYAGNQIGAGRDAANHQAAVAEFARKNNCTP